MYTDMMSQLIVGGIFSSIWEYIKIALGWVMEGCYKVLDLCGIENLAVCIILFTIVIYSILLPLQIKNAKFQKLNSVMNPEIQAISKKYAKKTDNESRMKQQEELSSVYEKYGTSPTGGCLQSFIQLPILFAVYRVLYNVPNYVRSVASLFNDLIVNLKGIDGFDSKLLKMASSSDNALLINTVKNLKANDVADKLPNILYQFRSTDWKSFNDLFPSIDNVIESTRHSIDHVNSFLGASIAETPKLLLKNGWSEKQYLFVAIAILIPVLSGVFQWLCTKMVPQPNTDTGASDTASSVASSMKTVMYIMPLFSVYICFTLPLGIGIYWTMSAIYRTISQIFINKKMENISVDDLIKKNQDKINKKRAKKGLPPKQVINGARTNTKNIKVNTTVTANKKLDGLNKTSNGSVLNGGSSMRDKANLVSKLNDKK